MNDTWVVSSLGSSTIHPHIDTKFHLHNIVITVELCRNIADTFGSIPLYVYEHDSCRVYSRDVRSCWCGMEIQLKIRKSPKVFSPFIFSSLFPYHHVIGEKCELFSRVLFSHSGNGSTHGHIFTIYGSPSCDFTVWFWNKIVLKISVE